MFFFSKRKSKSKTNANKHKLIQSDSSSNALNIIDKEHNTIIYHSMPTDHRNHNYQQQKTEEIKCDNHNDLIAELQKSTIYPSTIFSSIHLQTMPMNAKSNDYFVNVQDLSKPIAITNTSLDCTIEESAIALVAEQQLNDEKVYEQHLQWRKEYEKRKELKRKASQMSKIAWKKSISMVNLTSNIFWNTSYELMNKIEKYGKSDREIEGKEQTEGGEEGNIEKADVQNGIKRKYSVKVSPWKSVNDKNVEKESNENNEEKEIIVVETMNDLEIEPGSALDPNNHNFNNKNNADETAYEMFSTQAKLLAKNTTQMVIYKSKEIGQKYNSKAKRLWTQSTKNLFPYSSSDTKDNKACT